MKRDHAIKKPSYWRTTALSRALRAKMRCQHELPYDDDPEWNESFEKSLPALQKLAAKALKDFHEGRTTELDPDKL